jgi:acrylyl-CoA reductase (NADPH)
MARVFPLIPGIDLAGTVEASAHGRFRAGDKVILNGWGAGEGHHGGFAQKARVKAEWLVALPPTLSARQAMSIGTAGYTAMLGVMALERGDVTPDAGDILVTGACGGVGSLAVAILSTLGYRVVASTGRPGEAAYLQRLGAAAIIDRATLATAGPAVGPERWAGAIDTVGSHTLVNALAATRPGGTVVTCGIAGGLELPGTVLPFIVRGVSLAGIDSTTAPMPRRLEAWSRLARDQDRDKLELMTSQIALREVPDAARRVLQGKVRGRIVVDVSA